MYNDYDDFEDLSLATGDAQADLDDETAQDAVNGTYDTLEEEIDEIDTMMDAQADRDDIGEWLPDTPEVVEEIVAQCQGVAEDGYPAAAISLTLDMLNPFTVTKQTLAEQALYKPIVTINKRYEFVELILDFQKPNDPDMRVMLSHLNKYAEKMNEETIRSESVPVLMVTVVPIMSLGTYYAVFSHPVTWSISSPDMNTLPTQVKLLFKSQDLTFFQTDEVDLAAIESSIQREERAKQEFLLHAEEKEEMRRQRAADNPFLPNHLKLGE